MNRSIDINADLGEGLNNEEELMPYLSSCNIACGAHAGDKEIMRSVVQLAKKHQVKIGAHPSFPDRSNFGRQILNISEAELIKSLQDQIQTLARITREENCSIHHVKPHGALYNLAAKDERTAIIILELIKSLDSSIKLYAPYRSVIANMASSYDLDVVYEAFADRNYNEDLTLVSRNEAYAQITDEDQLVHHVYHMISKGKVKTYTGLEIDIKTSTICIHGDHPKAVSLIRHLTEHLSKLQIEIE